MKRNLILQGDSNSDVMELKNAQGIIFVAPLEIIYIKASNKHSLICKNDKTTVEVCHPLKWFTEILTDPIFFRCHDSYLVNLRYFNYLSSNGIVLNEDIAIPLSRQKKDTLKEHIVQVFDQIEVDQLQQISSGHT